MRQVRLLDHDQAVRLVHLGGGLGEEFVRCDPDRTGQRIAEALEQGTLDVAGDAFGVAALALAADQPTRHFVHRGRLAMRNAGLDDLHEFPVHLDVACWPGDLHGDLGTGPHRIGHPGAGADAVPLGFLAGGQAAGGGRNDRDDRHRLAAQVRRVELLHRSEERVEVDEQAAQGHGGIRLGKQCRSAASPEALRNFTIPLTVPAARLAARERA